MANYSEINRQGYGSPYVKAWLSDGREVTLSLTKFTYKYSEEKDDVCTLKLEYLDPNIVDDVAFTEDLEWTVQWGYIGGKSVNRKIYLRNVNPMFTQQGVVIEIKATCKGAYLKERKEKRVNKRKTLIDVAETIASDNGLNLVGLTDKRRVYKRLQTDNPDLDSEDVQEAIEDGNVLDSERDYVFLNKEGDVYSIVSQTKDVAVPTSERLQLNLDLNDDAINDTDGGAGTNTELLGEDFGLVLQEQRLAQDNARSQYTHFFAVHPDFVQGALSDKALLDEMASKEKDGPVTIETRDDNLIVKKPPIDSAPVRTFKYKRETRDVIRFKPQSKSMTKKAKASNTVTGQWNLDEKAYTERNVTEAGDKQPRMGDELPGSPRDIKPKTEKDYEYVGNASLRTAFGFILEDRTIEEVDPNSTLSGSGLTVEVGDDGDPTNDQILIVGDDYVNAAPGEDNIDVEYDDKTGLQIFANPTTAIDNTAVTLPTGGLIDINRYVESVENLEEEDAAQVENDRAKAAMDMNPASLTAEGDPAIECGQVVTVLGVGKRYSGNYYITESTHTIVHNSGYMMELKMKRNARKSTGNSNGIATDIKQYKDLLDAQSSTVVFGEDPDGTPTISVKRLFDASKG